MGNKVPDRAPYGSHLPSGIQYLANMAAAKQFHRTMSKQNLVNYADPNWKGPKGRPEGGAAGVPAKNPKAPKDPNLNPAAMPFPRR